MAIKLKWTNPNVQATTVEIYRGDTPLDRANLANPIATLVSGETEWVDSTATFERVYYYVLVTKRGNEVAVGPNNKVETVERKGAGPNNLRAGDDRLGYFGLLSPSEFFNSTDIIAAAKSTVGLPTELVTPSWYKFIRNGKILYVPNVPIGAGSVNWNSLYLAGLVYGTDDAGPANARGGQVATNQLVKLSKNGDEYLVRLPMGLKNDPSDVVDLSAFPTSDNTVTPIDTAAYRDRRIEFNDLFYPLFSTTPDLQRLLNVSNLSSYDYYQRDVNGSAHYRSIACQECRTDVNYAVGRGRSYYNASQPFPRDQLTNVKLIATNVNAGSTGNHRVIWAPVIELIAPVTVQA